MIWIIMLLIFAASAFVSWRLRSKFAEYSQIAFRGNMSGAEIAARMLRENGINDVRITCVEGQLTDHYNPIEKTVNLSPDVYHGRSVAAAAVAAHECGHAIQHARAYAWLTMRSSLVPAVSFASKYVQWILLAGVLTINVFPYLLLAGIALFALTTLFSFITLPVEFDASKRALNWLESTGIVTSREHDLAYDALKWAALTYVVAAIGSLATLLYYISIFMGRRRE
ncbi:MAG: zinc metallopeptidase [Chitinophagales bacterium]|nr:zinc metallopeptidase [Chitinophagales bacterium]MDW8273853.1 zinc metallopeptidase [Chitinophagales bacterium]